MTWQPTRLAGEGEPFHTLIVDGEAVATVSRELPLSSGLYQCAVWRSLTPDWGTFEGFGYGTLAEAQAAAEAAYKGDAA